MPFWIVFENESRAPTLICKSPEKGLLLLLAVLKFWPLYQRQTKKEIAANKQSPATPPATPPAMAAVLEWADGGEDPAQHLTSSFSLTLAGYGTGSHAEPRDRPLRQTREAAWTR